MGHKQMPGKGSTQLFRAAALAACLIYQVPVKWMFERSLLAAPQSFKDKIPGYLEGVAALCLQQHTLNTLPGGQVL